ncbi:hypothetical protein AV540_19375 [Brevibacillus parabrevis]|uniref:hypothetical protein n=1 Tax=Brevibacillus parabrevis TaxID=54914 RepID=UPI0007ABD376|nr:hypothetical protein [Brevibacillus parabrevis]KZE47558.1 hypothetical protein AV540_19375 [Brevibacillus parabrevis]
MIVSDVTQPQIDRAAEVVKDFNEFIDLIPIESKSDGGYSLYIDIQKGDVPLTVSDTRKFLRNWFKSLKIECDSNPRDFY